MRKTLAAIGAALLAAACSTVGVRSGTEEPRFEEIARVGEIEVRRYDDRIAAETVVDGNSDRARNEGFQRLAGYIFGGNSGRASISMTAPVDQSRQIAMTAPVDQTRLDAGRWSVRFFMPSEYAMDALPVPNDPRVTLEVVPGGTYAVLRFSGVGSVSAVAEHRARLLAGLEGSGWVARGEPATWFYDPPWTVPSFRRNEIAVRVERGP